MLSRAAKTAGAAHARFEVVDDVEARLHDGNDYQLRDPFQRLQSENGIAAIPARHHDLPLIVGVDQADEIAEHDAELVRESRTRQHESGESGIRKVDRDSSRNEVRRAWLNRNCQINARTQIESRGAFCRVFRKLILDARVKNFEINMLHFVLVSRSGGR